MIKSYYREDTPLWSVVPILLGIVICCVSLVYLFPTTTTYYRMRLLCPTFSSNKTECVTNKSDVSCQWDIPDSSCKSDPTEEHHVILIILVTLTFTVVGCAFISVPLISRNNMRAISSIAVCGLKFRDQQWELVT